MNTTGISLLRKKEGKVTYRTSIVNIKLVAKMDY